MQRLQCHKLRNLRQRVIVNNMKKIIKIGTRGSKLALWQANWVKSRIETAFPDTDAHIVKIKTTGDRIVDRPLAQVGGKGLFVKEIEKALFDKEIDIAVHSMKDMPGELPDGLFIGAVPVRENPYDVLISRENLSLEELPAGAIIGTSSLRRASQIKYARPDIVTTSIRGNLGTRLAKLDSGEFDAILLAAAGIIRLGLKNRISQILDEEVMLPAVGQGALCIEAREGDTETHHVLEMLDHFETKIPVLAERAFLKRLEGSCHIPVACFAKLKRDDVVLTGLVASTDGTRVIKETLSGKIESTEQTGIKLAELLLKQGAREILDNLNETSSAIL